MNILKNMTNTTPFGEHDLRKGHYFKLHINENPVNTGSGVGQNQHSDSHPDPSEIKERNLKNIFKDAGRQIAASFIILVLGFFILNWSAYSKIAKSKWDEFRGIEESSPLADIAQPKRIVRENNKALEVSSDPDIQKKQIPALAMDISPFDDRIIIPRIDQNLPIVKVSSESLIKRDWSALEKEMQSALQDGVVHYPGTSLPGQTGNVVITGHSSYFPWDPGRFKDVFALLHEMVIGDKVVVYFEQDKYIYEVDDIKVVLPNDIEVLKQGPKDKLTLITCTPVGTNLKRLIVSAKPVSKNGKPI